MCTDQKSSMDYTCLEEQGSAALYTFLEKEECLGGMSLC